jgi:hypothetical protein
MLTNICFLCLYDSHVFATVVVVFVVVVVAGGGGGDGFL